VGALLGLEALTGMPELHLWLLPAAYTSAGLLVGVLIGLTGIGGGSLLTPLLVTVFGQSPIVSVGTDLAFAAGTKLVVMLTTAMLEDVAGYQTAATVATGALIGMAVALTSVGAGALGTVALVFLYPLRLSTDRLVATDIAQALPLTALAALGHVALGHTDWSLVLSLMAGSVPGVLVGSRLAVKIPEVLLRRLLAATLGVSAWRLFAYQG
jgi:uncharacterized membrane protein YfcA